ncbi:MAG: hypothetical protein PUB18_00100 [bacterium]|nr:hypothetical protein [bacterium]
MPGPKTHDIFYQQLKRKLHPDTLKNLPHYDEYRLFAQGHDFLIYHDFYKLWNSKKLHHNIQNSVLLQEHKFQQFVYCFLKTAKNNGAIEDEQTRLFIGPGYIMHHLLDAYTHPFIIYYAGDHTRDPNNKTWQHGIVENLIDIHMMKTYEKIDPKVYPVYQDFAYQQVTTNGLLQTLDQSLYEIYGISNGGNIFNLSFYQVSLFMKAMKFDKLGLKRLIFDKIDPFLKGTSSFSYHREVRDVTVYLNEEHELWFNPLDANIQSTESFMDLYHKALTDGAYIIDQLEKICESGMVHRDDIYSLIPNVASTYGLECGRKFEIQNKKVYKK